MDLFNKCWEAGSLPSRWGKARVRMLHKRGSKHECTNYQGISLLDVMSEMYEEVLDQTTMHVYLHCPMHASCGRSMRGDRCRLRMRSRGGGGGGGGGGV
jgi:hypothetical protein